MPSASSSRAARREPRGRWAASSDAREGTSLAGFGAALAGTRVLASVVASTSGRLGVAAPPSAPRPAAHAASSAAHAAPPSAPPPLASSTTDEVRIGLHHSDAASERAAASPASSGGRNVSSPSPLASLSTVSEARTTLRAARAASPAEPPLRGVRGSAQASVGGATQVGCRWGSTTSASASASAWVASRSASAAPSKPAVGCGPSGTRGQRTPMPVPPPPRPQLAAIALQPAHRSASTARSRSTPSTALRTALRGGGGGCTLEGVEMGVPVGGALASGVATSGTPAAAGAAVVAAAIATAWNAAAAARRRTGSLAAAMPARASVLRSPERRVEGGRHGCTTTSLIGLSSPREGLSSTSQCWEPAVPAAPVAAASAAALVARWRHASLSRSGLANRESVCPPTRSTPKEVKVDASTSMKVKSKVAQRASRSASERGGTSASVVSGAGVVSGVGVVSGASVVSGVGAGGGGSVVVPIRHSRAPEADAGMERTRKWARLGASGARLRKATSESDPRSRR